MKTKNSIVGTWRITHTELWDREYLDLVVPAHITFKSRGQGELAFGALGATIDWRLIGDHVDFSFDGFDEGSEVTERGHATPATPNQLVGRIFFHLGDDSAFEATRKPD